MFIGLIKFMGYYRERYTAEGAVHGGTMQRQYTLYSLDTRNCRSEVNIDLEIHIDPHQSEMYTA